MMAKMIQFTSAQQSLQRLGDTNHEQPIPLQWPQQGQRPLTELPIPLQWPQGQRPCTHRTTSSVAAAIDTTI